MPTYIRFDRYWL